MATVTQRIKVIEQPRGGYVPVRNFKKIKLDDEKELNSEENISPILVGLAVDYMTRYLLSRDAKVAFNISLRGADIAKENRVTHIYKFDNNQEAIKQLEKLLVVDDAVLIKASNSMNFKEIVDVLL